MAVVLLMLVGLFMAGFALAGLPSGLRQLVAGVVLVATATFGAAGADAGRRPAPPPREFSMYVEGR